MTQDAGVRTNGDPAHAWALADRAANSAGVSLRRFEGLEDADRILRVLEATWGGHEPFPREMIRALADSGNVPILAFDGTEAIGVAFAPRFDSSTKFMLGVQSRLR